LGIRANEALLMIGCENHYRTSLSHTTLAFRLYSIRRDVFHPRCWRRSFTNRTSTSTLLCQLCVLVVNRSIDRRGAKGMPDKSECPHYWVWAQSWRETGNRTQNLSPAAKTDVGPLAPSTIHRKILPSPAKFRLLV
jgi:hypothetical protein